MFHYDRGLKLTALDLALDFRRRQPRGFISHAHTDHMAAHELALCTPETAVLYQHRHGPRQVRPLPCGQPLAWDAFRLTTYAAGHVLGSAMLLADDGETRLLYTGDFRLSPSATAAAAELPAADILVMECTFGDPKYRLPPQDRVAEQLVEIVAAALRDGRTPVIHAYVLGKGQEVTRILTRAGIRVLQHRDVFAVSRCYQACGCDLGDVAEYAPAALGQCAVVVPPRFSRNWRLPGLGRTTSIAVSGWAADPRYRLKLGVDYALPLSDHADYDELIECVERVGPRTIYCTHGPDSFVDRLLDLGFDARPLEPPRQSRLFR